MARVIFINLLNFKTMKKKTVNESEKDYSGIFGAKVVLEQVPFFQALKWLNH